MTRFKWLVRVFNMVGLVAVCYQGISLVRVNLENKELITIYDEYQELSKEIDKYQEIRDEYDLISDDALLLEEKKESLGLRKVELISEISSYDKKIDNLNELIGS